MDDQELRALVRHAIAKHAGGDPAAGEAGPGLSRSSATRTGHGINHASHALYELINVTEACLIEPAVLCNHCGYCKSHGH